MVVVVVVVVAAAAVVVAVLVAVAAAVLRWQWWQGGGGGRVAMLVVGGGSCGHTLVAVVVIVGVVVGAGMRAATEKGHDLCNMHHLAPCFFFSLPSSCSSFSFSSSGSCAADGSWEIRPGHKGLPDS